MNVQYYFDHQVNRAIAEGLRQRGIDVLTALEDGAATWEDEELLKRALTLGRVMFTQDQDFLALAEDYWQRGVDFAGIVFGHQATILVGPAIADLELIAGALTAEELRNRIEFIPL